MPTYSMWCKRCKTEFDIIRSMKEAPGKRNRAPCPDCGSMRTNRIFKVHSVIPDNFTEPLVTETLLGVRTGDSRIPDTVYSRSDLRRLEKEHDAKYGTKLVHSG